MANTLLPLKLLEMANLTYAKNEYIKDFIEYVNSEDKHDDTLLNIFEIERNDTMRRNFCMSLRINEDSLDLVRHHLTMQKWRKCKQVYRVHSELEKALLLTDTVIIPNGLLDKLPYKCIYFECDKAGEIGKIFEGFMVNVIPYDTKDGYDIDIFLHDVNGNFCRNWITTGTQDYKMNFGDFKYIQNNTAYSDEILKESYIYVVNTLLYLCSTNCEVRESELTKKTYRKPSVIKDKFREVQIKECGYIYGETIRKNNVKYVYHSDEMSKNVKNGSNHRPHAVRGHFHTYKVGKGRLETEIKWLEPYFTGVGEVIPTIHSVKQ